MKIWMTAVMMFMIIASTTVYHELNHAIVFEAYNCTNIHYSIDWKTANTVAMCAPNAEMTREQLSVERVQYNITMPIICIFILLLGIFQYQELEKK